VWTEAALAGRFRADGPVLAQVSPESICGDVGLDEALEDAQAAEITSDARVRTRAPSFFFMATPLQNRTPDYPRFGEEYTAALAWIEAARLLQEFFRFAAFKKGARSPSEGPRTRAFETTRFSRRD
jgi:hypothetical protein